MDPSWLTEKATLQEIEAENTPDAATRARDPRLPDKPFAFGNDRWEALKSKMQEGDELWYFCSPPESWQHLAGRAGIAIVRAGQIVDSFVTQMN
jgi:hypothetical protein